MPTRHTLAAPLALALTLTPALAEDARWQFGNFQNEDAWSFSPSSLPLSHRDLESIADTLSLDDTQRSFIDEQLDTLRSRHRQAWVTFAEQRSDAQHASRTNQDYAAQQTKTNTLIAEFRAEQNQLIEQFFADTQLVLTREQEQLWPRVELDRRRITTLVKYACFDDEAVDLIAVVSALDISDETRAELQPILDRYAQTLDPVLLARNRKAAALGKTLREIEQHRMLAYSRPDPMNFDPAEMEKIQQEINERQLDSVDDALDVRKAAARVRDVNREFMREIEKHLPEQTLEQWSKATDVKANQSPFAFMNDGSRATMMLKYIENLDQMTAAFETQMSLWAEEDSMADYVLLLRSIEPLTRSQRDQIEDIRLQHEATLARLDTRFGGKQTEPDDEPDRISIPTPDGTLSLMRVREDGAPQHRRHHPQQQDPEELEARAEADQQTIDRLRQVLTINQRALVAQF